MLLFGLEPLGFFQTDKTNLIRWNREPREMTLAVPSTENELRDRCPTCKKQFGKSTYRNPLNSLHEATEIGIDKRPESSLLRHLKICVGPQNRSRQKSCVWCSTTKSKCDLQMPSCGRCISRNTLCEYKQQPRVAVQNAPANTFGGVDHSPPSFTSQPQMSTALLESPRSSQEFGTSTHQNGNAILDPFTTPSPLPSNTSVSEHASGDVSFASMVAHFSEGSEDSIDNQHSPSLSVAWKQSIVPVPKPLSPLGKHSVRFSFRVLRTWPLMMSHQNPPIMHHTQTRKDNTASALANCHSIAKMWEGQQANPSEFLREITTREMTRLFQNVLGLFLNIDPQGLTFHAVYKV